MVEVCRKQPGDRGGIPVDHDGRVQVLEEFRLPVGFDASRCRSSTPTPCGRAPTRSPSVAVPWHWFVVEKQVDGQTAIQFERLLQELTSVLKTRYVEVPREGADARFLPVKNPAELDRRRAALDEVLRARGFLT